MASMGLLGRLWGLTVVVFARGKVVRLAVVLPCQASSFFAARSCADLAGWPGCGVGLADRSSRPGIGGSVFFGAVATIANRRS